jgi:molybdopterin molybdotransferase
VALLPVEQARARILANAKTLSSEQVSLSQSMGRILAKEVKARRDQPPFDASAMDGYAVIAADTTKVSCQLKVIGTSAAGHASSVRLKPGTACRIFTGAPVPKGADAILIQEDTEQSGSNIVVKAEAKPGQHIRRAGLDFSKGDKLLEQGTVLTARDIGLAAAANVAELHVRRKPRVAVFSTGDELVRPGERPRADQIVSSNSYALIAMAENFGAAGLDLGIVPDSLSATRKAIAKAKTADILLTSGGASVGDHDFVQQALRDSGIKVDFWKIAMRPGKPFMYGTRGGQHVLGLPGNPVSALVCARLFLKPLIDALLGLPPTDDLVLAKLGAAMKANDSREDYVRAKLIVSADGSRHALPFEKQDSSMQRTLREAHALIVRRPHAPPAREGDTVSVLPLDF